MCSSDLSGGGQAFRVGGEEFCLLFPGKSAAEATEHVELLRQVIAGGGFRARAPQDRRKTPHGPDRRRAQARKPSRSRSVAKISASGPLSVTISIGVAESTLRNDDVSEIVQLADKALYRAKNAGRNRVEVFGPTRPRPAKRSA